MEIELFRGKKYFCFCFFVILTTIARSREMFAKISLPRQKCRENCATEISVVHCAVQTFQVDLAHRPQHQQYQERLLHVESPQQRELRLAKKMNCYRKNGDSIRLRALLNNGDENYEEKPEQPASNAVVSLYKQFSTCYVG